MRHTIEVNEEKALHCTVEMPKLEQLLGVMDAVQQKALTMYIAGYELNEIAQACKVSTEQVGDMVRTFMEEVL